MFGAKEKEEANKADERRKYKSSSPAAVLSTKRLAFYGLVILSFLT